MSSVGAGLGCYELRLGSLHFLPSLYSLPTMPANHPTCTHSLVCTGRAQFNELLSLCVSAPR